MAEIRKARERVMLAFQNDPHVSMALRVSIGGYNLLLMSAHPDISEHMEWEQSLSKRFPSSIGRVDVTYEDSHRPAEGLIRYHRGEARTSKRKKNEKDRLVAFRGLATSVESNSNSLKIIPQ